MIFSPVLPAFAVSYYSTDFDSGAPAEFSSGYTNTESVQGYSGLGPGGDQFSGKFLRNPTVPGQATILELTGLPPHSGVDIEFLLAIIDSWDDGVCNVSPQAAPDYFNVKVDGNLIFSETFENACGTQVYHNFVDGIALSRHANLGFNQGQPYWTDSAYNIGADPTFQNIPHTSPTLKIEWYADGAGWQGGTIGGNQNDAANDESWAIDNVRINLVGEGQVIGGELLPINTVALLLAGTQSVAWMIPVLAGIAGVAAIYIKKRKN